MDGPNERGVIGEVVSDAPGAEAETMVSIRPAAVSHRGGLWVHVLTVGGRSIAVSPETARELAPMLVTAARDAETGEGRT